ncbi:outer membrane protein assembly factor BamB family protein [Sphingomonas morindae]|uniref:PQQ-binding-like beta-propeller repeat protein n=1 Tax=Sphingomonas morindae TaxID=1541170 RepID=A0ABY4X9M0_9SPHN|nr:PQQ-binding-like beta-propeller repeat protein [Sphingomonas morindae]USI73651.1 PQQ-binding-like beta-propeller repeat protein [Sphingomonas morindae]
MMMSGRAMRKPLAAMTAVLLLSGCGIFKGHGDGKPKTAVLGERVPVLTVEEGASSDPGLANTPVQVPPAEVNSGWPQPGGNPQKAMGNVALGAQPARVWTARLEGAKAGARLGAAPVIADGKLYVMDTTATVRAFNAATGELLWKAQLAGREGPALKRGGPVGLVLGKKRKSFRKSLFGGGVSYDNGKLYATNGLGEVAQLDAASGKIEWKVTPAGPMRGAPAIGNGAVYAMTQDNQLYALNEADGATQWTASGPLQSAGVFGAGAPAIARGTVIAGFSSGDLDAYRYENGRVVWQDALTRTSVSTTVGDVSDVDASPVVDDTRVYAVGAGGRTIALDLVTGQRLWELNIGGISTPALGGDWLFVVSDTAQLYCIQRTTGKIRWTTQLDRWKNPKKKTKQITWSGPVLAGGRLLLTSTDGDLAYVAPETGKVSAQVRISKKPVNLPPVVANSMLYTLASDGTLSAWR